MSQLVAEQPTTREVPLRVLDARMHAVLRVQTERPQTPDEFKRVAKAESTYLQYRSHLRHFVEWTRVPFPFPVSPVLLENYLSAHAYTLAPSTLAYRLAAIRFASQQLGYGDPTNQGDVRLVMAGIRRQRAKEGWAPNEADAFSPEEFAQIVDRLPEDLPGLRDRAYLLVGLFGAFRQSELAKLTVERLESGRRGIAINMGVTKSDQENERKKFSVLPRLGEEHPYCPVTALSRWLEASGIDAGPIWRGLRSPKKGGGLFATDRNGNVKSMSHTAVNNMLRRRALEAGISDVSRISNHSLRATFVTILVNLGVKAAVIARQTHHADPSIIDTTYYRPTQAIEESPAWELGQVFLRESGAGARP